ncbi:hypothetical protein TNCV_1546871 [Trichonephila clavipes]|nr:hypothetical protein TNCV_1546871 [Trichonephila clavipes]
MIAKCIPIHSSLMVCLCDHGGSRVIMLKNSKPVYHEFDSKCQRRVQVPMSSHRWDVDRDVLKHGSTGTVPKASGAMGGISSRSQFNLNKIMIRIISTEKCFFTVVFSEKLGISDDM